MNYMIGQRDQKKELTDTPKASLGNEMDVWDASPRPEKSACGNSESKFWYERHNESQKEVLSTKPPGGGPPSRASWALPGKPKILISLKTSSKNCCCTTKAKMGRSSKFQRVQDWKSEAKMTQIIRACPRKSCASA